MTLKRKRFYYIYKIVFLCGSPEGRYYYGKRTYYGYSIETDNYTGSGLFCSAYFKKYGTVINKTYIKEIVEINDSQEQNRDREVFWIGDLWKTDPLCMNLAPGGKGSCDHDTLCYVQDKYKKDIAQYDLYGNFIRKWHGIRETARELGVNKNGIIACITGKKPSAFGYQWRYYTGNEEPIECFYKIEPIVQYTKNGEYVAEFERPIEVEYQLGIDSGSIREVCQGKRISAGNYIWRFKDDVFDKYRITPKNINRTYKKKIRPVLQYTINGQFICEYDNVSEALIAVNGKATSAIYENIKGSRKSAYGYLWKFKDLCQS